jgi:hypothetical protein
MFTEATVEELTSIVLLFKKAHSSGDIHTLDLTISKTIAKKNYKVKPHLIQASEELSGEYNFRGKVSYLYTTKDGVVPVIDEVLTSTRVPLLLTRVTIGRS